MFEFKRIVCPADFSEGAALAVSQASELAQQSVQKVRRVGSDSCLTFTANDSPSP